MLGENIMDTFLNLGIVLGENIMDNFLNLGIVLGENIMDNFLNPDLSFNNFINSKKQVFL